MISLSIVICTYDRVDILYDCIASIYKSIGDRYQDQCEVIIVNNHPDSQESLLEVLSPFVSLKIITESSPGLSMARNAGIRQAKNPWIAFIDDDALVPEDYISRAMDIIEYESYDCFGGHIKSWWKYPRPRWLDDSFGSKPALRTQRDILQNEEYNWGSNIVIKKAALDDIGGFPTHIGMKGKKIGYAAENIVQDQLRAKGYTIGYDPKLSIDHLVLPAKLKLSWHIRSAYATARDGREVFPDDYTLLGYLKTIRRIIAAPVKGLFKLTKTGYFWENWVLESLKPWAQLVGKMRSNLMRM